MEIEKEDTDELQQKYQVSCFLNTQLMLTEHVGSLLPLVKPEYGNLLGSLGYVYPIPNSFLYHHEKLFGMVWIAIAQN